MKRIFAILILASNISQASYVCRVMAKMYIPQAGTSIPLKTQLTVEVESWQDCYKAALTEASRYNVKEKGQVEIKIFGMKSSDQNSYVYALVDWKLSTAWYAISPKGTVNSMSSSEPATGMQAIDEDGSPLFR